MLAHSLFLFQNRFRLKTRMSQLVCFSFLVAAPCQLFAQQNSEPEADESAEAPADELDPSTRYESLETFARGLFYLETLYVDKDKVRQPVMIQSALQGIVSQLDPHTVIMPPKAFEQLTIDTQGKFGGVGIIVANEEQKIIVISAMDDSPAAKAGMLAGDEIVKIDGKEVNKMKSGEAIELMRGEPGSKIQMVVKRKDHKELITFNLMRDIIKVRSVRSNALGDDVLYARISSFQDNSFEELSSEIKNFEKKNKQVRGFILDLRDNPGGLLDQAVKISDLFIESGIIVSTVGRDPKKVEREFAHKPGTYTSFPMVVLINGGSASASEIVAGALQDHKRAMIIGETSFGKGSVQTLVSLPDGSGLKVTVARYYTPNDRSIQAKGIEPDIMIPTVASQVSGVVPVPNGRRMTKESDLKGHIESQDLSDFSKNNKLLVATQNWPEPLQKDNQLVSAFSYIKSWNVFQNFKK